MGNCMVCRKGFFLREQTRQSGYEKIHEAHRFKVFRTPLHLALPIAPYLAAPPALPRYHLTILL